VATYKEANAKCKEIKWNSVTEHVEKILSLSSRNDELSKLEKDFWNQYIYPDFENIYFYLYPEDRGKNSREIDARDYHNKMVIALCDWLEEHGFFHFFNGKTIFIAYQPWALSDLVLLDSRVPLYVISDGDLTGTFDKIVKIMTDKDRLERKYAFVCIVLFFLGMIAISSAWQFLFR
jgi:hypothetical protein